jgi:signal transduction histidine kinase
MTPGEMGRMFEPFFRGERVQHLTGSGLGLALVKELVTVHGGKILCTSTPDIGTTMTIKLPRVFSAE